MELEEGKRLMCEDANRIDTDTVASQKADNSNKTTSERFDFDLDAACTGEDTASVTHCDSDLNSRSPPPESRAATSSAGPSKPYQPRPSGTVAACERCGSVFFRRYQTKLDASEHQLCPPCRGTTEQITVVVQNPSEVVYVCDEGGKTTSGTDVKGVYTCGDTASGTHCVSDFCSRSPPPESRAATSSAGPSKPYQPRLPSGTVAACERCGSVFFRRCQTKRDASAQQLCPACRGTAGQFTVVVRNPSEVHVCDECGKAFTLRGNLTKHVAACHSGEKPFACSECGKAFNLRGNLQKHSLVHSGEKLFRCPVAECGRTFTLRGNLKKHELVHSGNQPFKCNECGRRFSLKGNLKAHVQTKHKSKEVLV